MNLDHESDIADLMGVFRPSVIALVDAYKKGFRPEKVNTVEVWLLAAAMIPFTYKDAQLAAIEGMKGPLTSSSDATVSPSGPVLSDEELGRFVSQFGTNISLLAAHILVKFPFRLLPGGRYRYARAFFEKLRARLDEYDGDFEYDVRSCRFEVGEGPSLFLNLASSGASRCIRNYEPQKPLDSRLLLPMSVLTQYYLNLKRLFRVSSFRPDSSA